MSTKAINSSQLSGIALAYAVGTVTRQRLEILPTEYGTGPRLFFRVGTELRSFRPDREIAQAWPPLCRYGRKGRLELHFHYNGASCLQAGIRTGHTADCTLTAALRALVTHLHGHAIEIPVELLNTEQMEGAA